MSAGSFLKATKNALLTPEKWRGDIEAMKSLGYCARDSVNSAGENFARLILGYFKNTREIASLVEPTY